MRLKKLTIITDLDSTVVALLPSWISLYNQRYQDHLTVEDVKTFDIDRHVKPECGSAIFGLLDAPGLFRGLPALGNAPAVLEDLHRSGHEILVATAVHPAFPKNIADKWAWVQQHLPFVDRGHFVVASKKHHLRGDVFLDDSPEQITAYRQAWPQAWIGGLALPYNAVTAPLMNLRAESHENPVHAWNQLHEAIKQYSYNRALQPIGPCLGTGVAVA